MTSLMKTFLEGPMAKQALIVPIAIMLLFSVFNLTAPMDPARAASEVRIGVVNLDQGLPMPPIKISERLLSGMGDQLPFVTKGYDDREAAVADLEAGALSLVLVFPEAFSAQAFKGDQAQFEIVTSPAVTVAEAQFAGQLERLLPMAMSAGVASMKLAMAEGRMPSGAMPVSAEVTRIEPQGPMAAIQAPFAMLYTTWLAAFVGALMMVLATRGRADRATVAVTRTVIPVVVTGAASLVLALIVGATAGWASFVASWLVVWPTALVLTWFFVGLMSLLGLWVIVLIVPLVFYQSAIGGVMSPAGAAPGWLSSITSWAGLDSIGAAYRGAVHGIDLGYPVALIGIIAIVGLALIWGKSTLPAPKAT